MPRPMRWQVYASRKVPIQGLDCCGERDYAAIRRGCQRAVTKNQGQVPDLPLITCAVGWDSLLPPLLYRHVLQVHLSGVLQQGAYQDVVFVLLDALEGPAGDAA